MEINIMLLMIATLLFCCKDERTMGGNISVTPADSSLANIESRWKDYISLYNYLIPFWKADTIHEEIT